MPSTYYVTQKDIDEVNANNFSGFQARLRAGKKDDLGNFVEAFDTLSLKDKGLGALTVEKFAQAIHGSSVKHVVLSSNNFGIKTIDRGTYETMLAENKELPADTVIQDEYRDMLLKNELPADGAELFIKAMPVEIETLDLSSNLIGPGSVQRIGEAIRETNVKMLLLHNNNISVGAETLVKELRNSGVKVLNLTNNKINDETAQKLLNYLQFTQLDTVIMHNNDVHATTLIDIQDYLHKMKMNDSPSAEMGFGNDKEALKSSFFSQALKLKEQLYQLQGLNTEAVKNRMVKFKSQCQRLTFGQLNSLVLSLQLKVNNIKKHEDHSDGKEHLIDKALEKRRRLLELKGFDSEKIQKALKAYRDYCYRHSNSEIEDIIHNDHDRIMDLDPSEKPIETAAVSDSETDEDIASAITMENTEEDQSAEGVDATAEDEHKEPVVPRP